MSCFAPMACQIRSDPYTGEAIYQMIGKYHPNMERKDDFVFAVPCGKCLGCRLDYARRWADRLLVELDHTGKGLFLTLTYNDDHVPRASVVDDGNEIFLGQTLDVRDLQLFNKRLRKHFEDREIRFYGIGEYGGLTERPHYHEVVFGIDLEDFRDDLEVVGVNELGQEYYTSQEMQFLWTEIDYLTGKRQCIGFVGLSEISYNTCAYVARYCMKKAFNETNKFESLRDNEEYFNAFKQEFSVMSRRPGIGAYYLEDHPDDAEYTKVWLSDQNGSKVVNLPKYCLEKIKNKDFDRYSKIMDERKAGAKDSEWLRTFGTDLPYDQYLDMLENDLIDRTSILTKKRVGI